jgi:hypothetical protein
MTDHQIYSTSEYYGVEATLDVYGFTLQPGQLTEGGIWISSGGGQASQFESMVIGWHVSNFHYYSVASTFEVFNKKS